MTLQLRQQLSIALQATTVQVPQATLLLVLQENTVQLQDSQLQVETATLDIFALQQPPLQCKLSALQEAIVRQALQQLSLALLGPIFQVMEHHI